jgi:hypothetical protein
MRDLRLAPLSAILRCRSLCRPRTFQICPGAARAPWMRQDVPRPVKVWRDATNVALTDAARPGSVVHSANRANVTQILATCPHTDLVQRQCLRAWQSAARRLLDRANDSEPLRPCSVKPNCFGNGCETGLFEMNRGGIARRIARALTLNWIDSCTRLGRSNAQRQRLGCSGPKSFNSSSN